MIWPLTFEESFRVRWLPARWADFYTSPTKCAREAKSESDRKSDLGDEGTLSEEKDSHAREPV